MLEKMPTSIEMITQRIRDLEELVIYLKIERSHDLKEFEFVRGYAPRVLLERLGIPRETIK